MNVLFVCTGNICRSPMAQGLALNCSRSKLINFKSAGTYAPEGAPASREAVKVLAELAVDIKNHTAKQYDNKTGAWADLILAMEAHHIEDMKAITSGYAFKMHTMLGYAAGIEGNPKSSMYNIADPYAMSIEFYRKTRDQIANALKEILNRI